MKTRIPKKLHIQALAAFLMAIFATTGVAQAAYGQDECDVDENTVRMNFSLYYEDFKNESYETALPYLGWILKCAPGFPSNNDRNFRRAVEAYEGMAAKMEDPEMKRTYLDSALYVFDIAVPTLKEAGVEVDEFEWIFREGRFIQSHADVLSEMQGEVAGLYMQAWEMNPEGMQPYYINFIISDLVNRDMKGDAVDYIDRVEETYPDNEEITGIVEQWRGQLFTSPEERIGFLEGQREKNPDDEEILMELFELYQQEGYRDMVYELAPVVLEKAPTARTYRMVGKMRLEDGDSEEAIDLYERSLEMEGGTDAAREIYYNIGLAHQQQGRLSRARTFFRRSLEADPSYAQALMAIGDLYQTAVQNCSTFEREDRAVYWLATDYFERAARVADSEAVAQQARQRAAGLRQYYPTAEDKFFKDWTAGDRYMIDYGCYTWINEATTVR